MYVNCKQYDFISLFLKICVNSWQPMFPGDKAEVFEEQVQSQGGTGTRMIIDTY